MHRRFPALALIVLLPVPAPARAQQLTIPSLDWQTVETKYFVIHYPAAASVWALDVARHIDAVHNAVSALVGNAPHTRTTVVIEDPNSASNGFAIPFLDKPLIFFWPTPPEPTSGLADNPGWGEILSVHEYTHIAHLTRPSRNPMKRLLSALAPVRFGPLALTAPRWITEGYATYVEGKLTGSGRPHSAGRAAVLREWARDGKLPTYNQLNTDPRFMGGSMAYLVGSAYLQWLVARAGDSSLVYLWRRMSARRVRSFDDAFAGVFGGEPDDLYGRFTAELTEKALQVERDVRAELGASAADSGAGRVVQVLRWNTGAPAVSRDGKLLAIVLAAKNAPSRVVVWKTSEPPADTLRLARARAREHRLDPEDVPAIPWRPAPKRALATLYPHGGAAYFAPRFLPDGDRLLLVRLTGRGDGAMRPDLFLWNFRTGTLRRVTHDAAIRSADPSPDGRFAVGDQCIEGICSVVRIELASGRVTQLVPGAPRVVYHAPRYSPGGDTIAVNVQENARWHVALLDARPGASHTPHLVGPDDGANRYDPAFLPDGRSLVLTSDETGIPNLELLDLTTGATQLLTDVTSAAFVPAPNPASDSVYFLRLSPKGLNLDVISTTVVRNAEARLSPSLAPAAPPPGAPLDTFPAAPIPPPHAYGLGQRQFMALPTLSYAAEGTSAGLMFSSTDPVGRLTWLGAGLYGARGSWRGGTLGVAWRGTRPLIGGELFYAETRPSQQHGGFAGPATLDINYAGATMRTELDESLVTNAHRIRLGASFGELTGPAYNHRARVLGFAAYRGAFRQTPGDWTIEERLGVDGSGGATAGAAWARGIVSGGLSLALGGLAVEGSGAYGIAARGTGALDQFALGGTTPPLFDPALLTQRIAMPALPASLETGRQVASYRVGLPGYALEPYFWAGSAGERLGTWQRVVGLDWSYHAEGLWAARLPTVDVRCGFGYSLDRPVRDELRGYLTLTYRP